MKRIGYNHHENRSGMIGTPWKGKHIAIIRCCADSGEVTHFSTSISAPAEPPHHSCAETLSRMLSIGYEINQVFQSADGAVHYILIYTGI